MASVARISGLRGEGVLVRLRRQAQRLTGPGLRTPEEVVGWLGAMQAQEFALAKWSIGQRAPGVTEADVDRALAAGAILRTHVLRPTWHFVLAADIRWMVELTAPRVKARMAPYDRMLGLDERLYARCNAVIARALAGGRHLTRIELGHALRRGGVVAEGQRLAHIMVAAEQDLVACSGVPRGKRQTYALLDERAPRAKRRPREEALAELTRRYFASHGPATARDYAWWASLTVEEAKRAVALVERELERLVVKGRVYFVARARRETKEKEDTPRAHLLQAYDEYVIAYTESRSLLDPTGRAGGVLGARRFPHAVALDGRVVGHWRRLPDSKATAVEGRLSRRITAPERRALEIELERYARFTGLPAELRWRRGS